MVKRPPRQSAVRFKGPMGFHSAFRVAATTASLAAMLGGFGAHAAETAQNKCRGVDMLAETQARDPALYRQIMAQAEATKNAGTVLWKIDRADDLMETLVQLYLDRKIAAAMPFQIAIARQVGVNDEAYAGFQQKLLVERNAKMRAAAEPLLEQGGVFIAIGALHLSGDKGLVALLQESGYTLTPIE